jgi:tripartite-type tricarboxylate transporter receptor subunit TctC
VLLAVAAAAHAQTYPAKAVRLIVPFPPGGSNDIVGRIVAQSLGERLGKTVVVDNRAGGNSIIGSDIAAQSAPDGHTLLVISTSFTTNPIIHKLPYDPLKSFAWVAMLGVGPNVLAVPVSSPVKTVKDLIAMAKAKPGALVYASTGVGSNAHFGTELFKHMTGTDMLHVPYKGSAGALTDLLSGEVNVGFVPVHVAMPLIKAGRLKPLAAGAKQRNPSAPDVPTLDELGYRGIDVEMWYAFFTPRGTPPAVVAKLNAEMRAILADAEVKASFDKVGLDVASSTPDELMKLMQRDNPRWREVIRNNNITAQ